MSKKSYKKRRVASPPPPKRFPWLWLTIGAALVLVAGGLGLVWSSSADTPAVTPAVNGSPRLAVDRTEVDEGYIKLNTVVRSTFQLSNVGDQPLKIIGEPWVELIEGC